MEITIAGVTIYTGGPWCLVRLTCGWFVAGHGLAISLSNETAARAFLSALIAREEPTA